MSQVRRASSLVKQEVPQPSVGNGPDIRLKVKKVWNYYKMSDCWSGMSLDVLRENDFASDLVALGSFGALGVSGDINCFCLSVSIILQYGVVTPALILQARPFVFCK